jgi:hypothetical protein
MHDSRAQDRGGWREEGMKEWFGWKRLTWNRESNKLIPEMTTSTNSHHLGFCLRPRFLTHAPPTCFGSLPTLTAPVSVSFVHSLNCSAYSLDFLQHFRVFINSVPYDAVHRAVVQNRNVSAIYSSVSPVEDGYRPLDNFLLFASYLITVEIIHYKYPCALDG